jgi:hypothetical protein
MSYRPFTVPWQNSSRPEELIEAAEKAYASGYRKMDAYAPMPVEGWRRRLDSQEEQSGFRRGLWRQFWAL